jgi:hypothetical protein
MASTRTAASAPNIGNGFDAGIGNYGGRDFWGNFAERAHAT